MASCMLCIRTTCKVINQNSPLWLKRKTLWNKKLMKQHLMIQFFTGCCADQRVHDLLQSLLWKQVMSTMMKVGLCFAQIMCAMSLFSVPVWASIPRPKGAGCRTSSTERPAPQTSLFPELCQSGGYTWTNTYATRDWKPEQRANQHDNMDAALLYASARLWTQAQREGSRSLQQGRTERHTAALGAWGWFCLCCLH